MKMLAAALAFVPSFALAQEPPHPLVPSVPYFASSTRVPLTAEEWKASDAEAGRIAGIHARVTAFRAEHTNVEEMVERRRVKLMGVPHPK